jgi:hypothetical protein
MKTTKLIYRQVPVFRKILNLPVFQHKINQFKIKLKIVKNRRRFRFLKGCSHLLLVQLV